MKSLPRTPRLAETTSEMDQGASGQRNSEAHFRRVKVELCVDMSRADFELPQRLRAARSIRRWTQRDLARRMNVPPSCIAHFESGARKPAVTTLRLLADALSVSADYLLGRIAEDTHASSEAQFGENLRSLRGEDMDLAKEFVRMLANRNKPAR